MFVIYGTLPIEYYGDEALEYGGLIAVSGDYKIYASNPSDCEWLIPGTWAE